MSGWDYEVQYRLQTDQMSYPGPGSTPATPEPSAPRTVEEELERRAAQDRTNKAAELELKNKRREHAEDVRRALYVLIEKTPPFDPYSVQGAVYKKTRFIHEAPNVQPNVQDPLSIGRLLHSEWRSNNPMHGGPRNWWPVATFTGAWRLKTFVSGEKRWRGIETTETYSSLWCFPNRNLVISDDTPGGGWLTADSAAQHRSSLYAPTDDFLAFLLRVGRPEILAQEIIGAVARRIV